MKTHLITSQEVPPYEAFLGAHSGSLMQSWDWGEFQEGVPSRGKFWALVCTEGDKWLGTAMIVRQSLPFGLCWFSIARGPVFAKDVDKTKVWAMLLTFIKGLAKQQKAVFVRVEPPANLPAGAEEVLFRGRDWRKAHAHYYPEWTLKVDLSKSEEEILNQMKSKGRYNIKVAEKRGVTVHMTHNPKDVSSFYSVLKGTGGRDGFAIHPESYYQKFIESAHGGKWGALFVTELEGKVIGGLLATFYGDTATYYYGASDHAERASMAPYLAQWVAMQEGKKRGCKWYDFLGVAPPDQPKHPWAGITQFKEKFGGERFQYPEAREIVFKSGWYFLILLRKYVSRIFSPR